MTDDRTPPEGDSPFRAPDFRAPDADTAPMPRSHAPEPTAQQPAVQPPGVQPGFQQPGLQQPGGWAPPPSEPYGRPAETSEPYGRPAEAAAFAAAPDQPLGAAPGQPPAGTAQPARRKGPGWGALIGACLVCSLVGGGVAAGVTGAVLGNDRAASGISEPASQASAPPVGDGTLDWRNVAAAVSPSVVSIQVAGQDAMGAGSGVVIDDQGHILTNYHVAMGAGEGAQVQVALPDGRLFKDVEVVGLDQSTDLAVLKLRTPPGGLKPLPFGDSSKVVPGQPVMAVGNPLGLSDTVTTGIVSATNRPVITQSEQAGGSGNPELITSNAIQTDAAVNPGNSGGALVDASGSLIGIPSSIAALPNSSNSQGSIGLGFAIPSNEARRIADELIKGGKVEHSQLGVFPGDGAGTADGQLRSGATVREVIPDSAAAEAGLRTGDVIVAIDGEPVSSSDSLIAQVRERAPGEKLTLSYLRDDKSQDVEVTLRARGN